MTGLVMPAPLGLGHFRNRRLAAILLVLALHAAPLLLFMQGKGLSGADGRGGASGGEAMVMMELTAVPYEHPATADSRAAPPPTTRSDRATEARSPLPRPAGIDGDDGDQLFEQQLAMVLADDPAAGGGVLDYGLILRRHLEAHGRNAQGRSRRPGSRLATLRVRVAREGQVIDARVLRSADADVGELALAALWSADPLPAVPAILPAPLEVDVPILVRMPG